MRELLLIMSSINSRILGIRVILLQYKFLIHIHQIVMVFNASGIFDSGLIYLFGLCYIVSYFINIDYSRK